MILLCPFRSFEKNMEKKNFTSGIRYFSFCAPSQECMVVEAYSSMDDSCHTHSSYFHIAL